MAAKAQKMEKPVEEVTKNRKVDSTKLGGPNLAPPKNRSSSDATSCISSSGDATSTVKESDMDQESMMTEQGYYYPASSYYGYSYPGYDGSVGEWDDQGYVISGDGMEMQYPVMQAENGSLMYYMPSFQPGYAPYSPYSPGTYSIDGQYMGQQPYLMSPMTPQPVASPGYFPSPLPYGSEVMPSYMWDPSLLVGDATYFDVYGGVSPSTTNKSNFSTPSHTLAPAKAMSSSKSSSNLGIKGNLPPLDVSSGPGILNDLKQVNKVAKNGSEFQSASVLAKGYFPVAKFPCSPQAKSGYLYPNSPANFKANGRGWGAPEKFKPRGKSVTDFDLLNEQNRGPRTNSAKGVLPSEADPAGSLVSEPANDSSAVVIRRDQYNLADFLTKYDHALFFVIKSYSEDDIHKSIKYNVWASTPNGNRRLDSAYQDAQEFSCQKDTKCPVFLFFSVNASGQFCGVAEMVGRVDFDKNMDFWQQDKWNGFFPVKWHIIKDVPNPHFRHIILENNDNKPVTNSRDTQEVKFSQGSEMLNIFKNYSSKTSILDDFTFYESRQKAMLEKRTRPATPYVSHLQKPDEITQVATALQSIDLSASTAAEEVTPEDKPKE